MSSASRDRRQMIPVLSRSLPLLRSLKSQPLPQTVSSIKSKEQPLLSPSVSTNPRLRLLALTTWRLVCSPCSANARILRSSLVFALRFKILLTSLSEIGNMKSSSHAAMRQTLMVSRRSTFRRAANWPQRLKLWPTRRSHLL